MGTALPDERSCGGFARSHVATVVALVYFFLLTVMAAVARRQIGVLAEASTAEGNDETLFTNPLIVSLACALVFALFDLACVALLWLLSRPHDEPTTALKFTWAGTLFLCVVWLTLCVVGSYLSFGDVKDEIKQACGTLDTHCFSTYEAIQWTSIIMEVIGLFLAGWMVVSTGSHIHPGFFHQSASASSRARPSGRGGGAPRGRGDPDGDEERLLAGRSGPQSTSADADAYSLSRRSHSRRRADPRRGSTSEHSLRKARYDDDPVGDGRGRSRSRRRESTSSVAAREIRRVQEEAERAMRSLSHARRAAQREGRESASSKKRGQSRRRSSSDEEREVRSMGKRRGGGSRSRSRSRARSSSSSDEASSSDNDSRGRRVRSSSRGRSSSGRRRR